MIGIAPSGAWSSAGMRIVAQCESSGPITPMTLLSSSAYVLALLAQRPGSDPPASAVESSHAWKPIVCAPALSSRPRNSIRIASLIWRDARAALP